MPTYDYLCNNCGHKFEKFQSITANPARKCPKCKKMSLQRLVGSGAGIIFKGSGFYETDYRSENYKQGQRNAMPKAKSASKTEKDGKPKEIPEKESNSPKKNSKKTA